MRAIEDVRIRTYSRLCVAKYEWVKMWVCVCVCVWGVFFSLQFCIVSLHRVSVSVAFWLHCSVHQIGNKKVLSAKLKMCAAAFCFRTRNWFNSTDTYYCTFDSHRAGQSVRTVVLSISTIDVWIFNIEPPLTRTHLTVKVRYKVSERADTNL